MVMDLRYTSRLSWSLNHRNRCPGGGKPSSDGARATLEERLRAKRAKGFESGSSTA